MRNNKRYFRGLLLGLLVLSMMTAAASAQQATLVTTDQVKELEFHDQINLVGRSEAWVESRVVSEVSGRVTKINASEGVWIKAGTPLVSINSEQIKLLLDAKKAEAEQARLEAELAHTQLNRAKELFGQNLISQAAYDSAVTWAGIKDNRYSQLDAERKKLALDHKNSVIRALYDGYTGRKLTDVGEWVSPGMPVFEMVDLSKIRVTVDLPERYYGRLAIGSPVSLVASGNGGEELKGTVTGFAPNASAETHTFPVIIEVPNSENKLGGGMLVRATLSLDDTFKSLAVSKDAIIRQGSQTLIYTIVEDKAAPIPVITTSTQGKMVAVQGEGLIAGMPVVVRGNERIFPGSPVRTAAAEDPTVGELSDKSNGTQDQN
jgi:membrane fusion protein (multidrug efflux system)